MGPAATLSILVKAQGAAAAATQLTELDAAAKRTSGQMDKASGAARKHSGVLSGLGKAAGLAGVAVGAAGLAKGISTAISEYREAQKVGAQTNAVLKSTGGAAGVTKSHIENLAGAISKKSGIDDEAIQSGENLLLTFTGIRNEVGKGNNIFDQATQTITDMSVALGQSGKNSAIQLGKALNDPIKGITALRRVGVSFTDQQKTQIETLTKSGDKLGAQKIILKELTKEFGGSAAAQATSGDKLKVALSNLAEAAGRILVPALDKVATFMTTVVNQFVEGKGIATFIIPIFVNLAAVIGDVVKIIVSLVKGFQDGNTWATLIGTAIIALTAGLVTYKIVVGTIEAVTRAWAAAQMILNVAVAANPFVIAAAAIVALGVALVIAYNKVDAFHKIVDDTFSWIKGHWPLLLGILTGPIGLAVVAIATHAGDIKKKVVGAFNDIVGAIHALASTFTGLGSWVIAKLVDGMEAVASTVVAIGGWVKNRVEEGIHDQVTSLIAVGSWIVNRVADGIKVLTDSLAGVGSWIFHQVQELVHNEAVGLGALGQWFVGRFIDGIKAAGKAISEAASWLKDQVVDAVKHFFGIKSPSTIMADLGGNVAKGLIHGIVGQDIPGFIKAHFGGIGDLAQNLVSSGWKGLGDFLGSGLQGPKAGMAGGASGALKAWLTTALKITGHYSEGNLAALTGRAMQESGGNPAAINLWDSNAKAGHPSKGLLQTIDSTFSGYALPGHGDIWNPIDNAIAAIRYMYAVYGHIVGPSGSGYALGTSGARKGWALVGERGPELMSMRGGEKIVPNNQIAAGGSTTVVEHHYHGPVVQDKDFIQYLRNIDKNYGRQNGRPAFGG